MQPVSVYLHSFSLRHHFARHQGFDIFAFIAVAREHGFDGVTISADGPGFGHLGGTDSRHFTAVHDALVAHELGVELETGDTRPQHLHLLIEVAAALGADCLRTRTRHRGTTDDIQKHTVADLRIAAQRAKITGVSIVLDNRGEFPGHQLAEIVQRVDSEYVRALFDYGNSQLVGEDPLATLDATLPVVGAVYVKDQLIVRDAGQLRVQGVAPGEGALPLEEITARLYVAGVRRFCLKNAWSYAAPLRIGLARLPDTPCFAVHDDRPLVDGSKLDPASAVTGEWLALQRGWTWFGTVLAAITGDSRLAPGEQHSRDRVARGVS
ncbi:MAG: sugar phosphate isomerase/epimerase [Gammaproteobacteria bacterium]|nr:sugar phosphate isomerase/epimerase [Gammaproteobacteria bacterium]